jgi:hypothetical protein
MATAMPLLSLSYDGYNRLSFSQHSSQGVAYYGYDPSNKRVWQADASGVDKFTYYNVLGQRTGNGNVYFAGRLIMTDGGLVVTDRLGSVRRRMDLYSGYWGEQLNYFPYGEEHLWSVFQPRTGALDEISTGCPCRPCRPKPRGLGTIAP